MWVSLTRSLIGHLSIKTKQKYSSNPTTHDDLHKRQKCNSEIVKRYFVYMLSRDLFEERESEQKLFY